MEELQPIGELSPELAEEVKRVFAEYLEKNAELATIFTELQQNPKSVFANIKATIAITPLMPKIVRIAQERVREKADHQAAGEDVRK